MESISNLLGAKPLNAAHVTFFIAGKNRCDENGRCSHLCLPNLSEFSCACPTGFMLLPDDKTCTESKSFFIMSVFFVLKIYFLKEQSYIISTTMGCNKGEGLT